MRSHAFGHKPMHLVTADELMRMPDDNEYSYELAEGRVIRMPKPGALHGIVGTRLFSPLVRFVEAHDLGLLFPQETGFLLTRDPDTVRGPDLAFVSRERAEAIGCPQGFWPGAPDLAVEIRSPHNPASQLRVKAHEYLRHGARLVWIIDPRKQEAVVYRAGEAPVVITRAGELDGGDVLPGFRLPLERLFT